MEQAQKPLFIIIVGACDKLFKRSSFWDEFAAEQQARYPSLTVQVERMFYLPWQRSRVQEFASAVLKKYDNGSDLILFGHSIGGLVASHVANQLQKSNVKAVIHFLAPVRLARLWKLQTTKGKTPTLSFRDVLDPLVPFFTSGDKHAVQTCLVLPRAHVWLTFSSHMVKQMNLFFQNHTDLQLT